MKKTSLVEISLVIPIYNEEECVTELLEKSDSAMKNLGRSYEILIVDDGSQDKTPQILSQLKTQFPKLRVIFFRKNFGQTPAMVAGFDHARGRVVVTMDGDLQNDPNDIEKLLIKMEEGYEIVSGWRRKRQDKWFTRKLPSIVANKLISILTGVSLHDYGCSLKAYKIECIRSIHAYSEMHRFFPAVASLTGARTAEIPVKHYARVHGSSKYGLSRTFKVFADLFTIFMITKFSAKPGILFGLLSVPFFLLSTIFLFITAGQHVIGADETIIFSGVTLFTFILAVHFICLGFLAVLILRRGKYKPATMSQMTVENA